MGFYDSQYSLVKVVAQFYTTTTLPPH